MSNKIKDTDYLVISARIRAMETGLLTGERMEQILSARSDEEVVKLLQENGYPDMSLESPEAMDAAITAAREETLRDLGDSAPDRRYLDIFKLKYDYHNAKAILKAQALGIDPDHMLTDLGRVPAEELKEAVTGGDGNQLPPLLAFAIAEGKAVLETTRDPQLGDMVLDRWRYQDELETAKETGSEFLLGYVRISIDAANLRALVRTIRMGKTEAFLEGVLFSGGSVDESEVLEVACDCGDSLEDLYAGTELEAAAKAGFDALKGGGLTKFEKLCDDAVSGYLSGAQLVAFGEAPLIGYLAARETEYTNLRILLMGRAAGLDPEIIRARLRT
ncbi:V-type ATPase subunit [Oscillibacter sp. GMB15532]|uniref:V-type ATPase subunit n=1 Tax=Oscillibacter sp. GMB15532 TaxID=3230022 RepID=UPI0034DFD355